MGRNCCQIKPNSVVQGCLLCRLYIDAQTISPNDFRIMIGFCGMEDMCGTVNVQKEGSLFLYDLLR